MYLKPRTVGRPPIKYLNSYESVACMEPLSIQQAFVSARTMRNPKFGQGNAG